MIKLVVFDLDGTLLDSLTDLANAGNYVLEKNGYKAYPIERYRYFVGGGMRKLIENVLPEADRTKERVDKMLSEFIPYYKNHAESYTRPYSGIIELLKDLKAKGYGIAIASNKLLEAIPPLVDKYFAEIDFDMVMGQREGVPTKPDPQIVFDIMKDCDMAAEHILYIGDTNIDMKTAKNAGVKSVGVLWGFRDEPELREAGADYIIKHPSEILEIAESMK